MATLVTDSNVSGIKKKKRSKNTLWAHIEFLVEVGSLDR